MQYYGNEPDQQEGYPLAAWIWGHRLRVGQHWMEYLLEFLNVLAGFEYQLGRGLKNGDIEEPEKYIRFSRLGLRRFVFYDRHEKSRHEVDDTAREALWQELQGQVMHSNGRNSKEEDEDTLNLARNLLRSFSAIEDARSWYAKSLFPIHENLLFWEGLRRSGNKPFSLNARNFFARGGEIYYLILSAGTTQAPERRNFIAQELKNLLTTHNQALGQLAAVIEQVSTKGQEDQIEDSTGELGWIPDPDCPLYVNIAEDLAQFLQAKLDPLEGLHLLAHLIGFHLTLYIYFRANPSAMDDTLLPEDFYPRCKPALLVDALEGDDGGIVRGVSAMLFRQQEQQQLEAAKAYLTRIIHERVQTEPDNISQFVEDHFAIRRLSKRKRDPYSTYVDDLIRKQSRTEISQEDFLAALEDHLFTLLRDDFQKNFLGVHRKLTKSIGFVSPRQGSNARFVLKDNLLKTLVLANVSAAHPYTYDRFLARLYERYGIVVGPAEARASGLFEHQRINAEYYERNKEALLLKLQRAGLAITYSDATALVSP